MKRNSVKFETFGVKIEVIFDDDFTQEEILKHIKETLPVDLEVLESGEKTEHTLSLEPKKKDKFEIIRNGKLEGSDLNSEELLERLDSQMRITVAEFAVGKVFVHSGVVEWKGKAIMIPASSYDGKTTLVTELVKRGAVYYSDEYAILDEKGLVHPFTKTLSIREDDKGGKQIEHPVETFGGKKGHKPISVGMVLVTKYKKGKKNWKPKVLTRGQGVLKIIEHTVPIRNNPELSLKILNKVVEKALIVKGKRGEVSEFAPKLLEYFEKKVLDL